MADARPPLLFVHGMWHGAWCWHEHFIAWFTERGFACDAVDLPGHGLDAANARGLGVDDYVTGLAHAVDALATPPILVGHSMGGLVVQRYLEAADLPAAVLLAPVPVGGVARAALRTAWHHPAAFARTNLDRRMGPIVGSVDLARSQLFADDLPAADAQRYAEMLQDDSYRAFLEMLVTRRPRPARVKTPVSVIAGGADRLFLVDEHRRTARAYGTQLQVVSGAAHDLMLDPRWQQAAELVAVSVGP